MLIKADEEILWGRPEFSAYFLAERDGARVSNEELCTSTSFEVKVYIAREGPAKLEA